MSENAQGGRIFFSNTGRTFGEEDELCVLSVGVDIGSSTEYVDNNNQAEAPIYFQENTSNKWFVFLDQYGRSPAGYYPYSANNGVDKYGYTDLGFPSGMPTQLKHGSIKPLTQSQYDEISAAWA